MEASGDERPNQHFSPALQGDDSDPDDRRKTKWHLTALPAGDFPKLANPVRGRAPACFEIGYRYRFGFFACWPQRSLSALRAARSHPAGALAALCLEE